MRDLSGGAGIIMLASHSHDLVERNCNQVLERNDRNVILPIGIRVFRRVLTKSGPVDRTARTI